MPRDIMALSAANFEKDIEYLSRLFGKPGCIEGCMVKLKGRTGRENYKNNFCDPLDEQTLAVSNPNNLVLFFKHTLRGLPEFDIFDGVTVMGTFSFTKGYKVLNRCKPAEMPCYLERYIADSIGNALSNLKISNNSFFDKNFEKGGMVLLADVKRHPEWKDGYLQDVETKFVNMCKSCGFKALKGCCPGYSAANRRKLKMVIGWHA